MAEEVVAGPAEGSAGLPVVVLAAHDVEGVAELDLGADVLALGPGRPHRQLLARGLPADQLVLVLWLETRRDGENSC